MTPDELKAYIATQIPDNHSRQITPLRVRNAMDAIVDNTTSDDALTIQLDQLTDFVDAQNTDVAPVIQGLIDAVPTNGELRLVYPSGTTYQSSVTTGAKTIYFQGQGINFTTIIPVTINAGSAVFQLDNAYCQVSGMTIDDSTNSWDNPSFNADPADTRALILVGKNSNSNARNCYIQNVLLDQSRAQGLRWEGGSFLVTDRLIINYAASGGIFVSDTSNGDCNHFKFRNTNLTGCFNFGLKGGDTGNAFSVGFLEAFKAYGCENYNIYIGGQSNIGMVFTEVSNGYRNPLTITNGSNVATAQKVLMANLAVGMVFNNGSTGLPNGTYITAIDKNAGTVTLSNNASSSGTNSYLLFTQPGNRIPSVWFGSGAYGNFMSVTGDSLDPSCFRDDNTSSVGRNIINFAANSTGYIYDNSGAKFRLLGSERQEGDPNNTLFFTTLCTVTNGSSDIVLQDTSVMNRIRNGATVSSPAFTTGTVSSVNQATFTVTISTVASQTGTFQVTFRANQRGGLLTEMFDDLQPMIRTGNSNSNQALPWMGRGARFVGDTTSASNQFTMVKRIDDENEAVANGKLVYCSDVTIIPDGTTISSFTGNDTTGYTITLSQNALLDRTGVFALIANNTRIRQVWNNTQVYAANTNAIANNARLGEIYSTINGNLRMTVTAANDCRYLQTWDPPSVASLGYTDFQTATGSPITVDTNGKSVTNAAVGDFVEVSCSRVKNGLIIWGEVIAANTLNLFIFNPTAAPIDLASSSFFIATSPK